MDKIIVVSNHSKNVFNETTYTGVVQGTEEEVTIIDEDELIDGKKGKIAGNVKKIS